MLAEVPKEESGNALNAAILIRWGAHPDVRLWRANAGRAWVPVADGVRQIQMNVSGCSDLLGLMRGGRLLAIETKARGDRMRPSQLAFRAMVEGLGGLFIEAHCVEDVDRALAAVGIRRAT